MKENNMKGKSIFTKNEINKLRRLIQDKINSTRDEQKLIRQEMRNIGFYISDFNITNLQPEDFEELIEIKRIIII